MKINKNILGINGKQVVFDFDILSAEQCDNVIIVLLDIPNNVDVFNNVYGVSQNAIIIWQIQDMLEIYDFKVRSTYVGAGFWDDSNGQFACRDFMGRRFVIDPQTGKITDRLTTTR